MCYAVPVLRQGHTASSSAAALSEAVDILSQIDFFQDLSEEALASVASVFTVWAYDPGQGKHDIHNGGSARFMVAVAATAAAAAGTQSSRGWREGA